MEIVMPLCIKEVPPHVGEFVLNHFRYEPETGYLYRTKTYSKSVDITKPAGSPNSQGYLDVDLGKAYGEGKVRNTRVHRIIWFLAYGYWPSFQIDHEDGDKRNNKLENLRPTDQKLNQANRKARTDVTSKYKGVGLHRSRWRAFICLGGVFHNLGTFKIEEDAAKAYDQAAIKHFGLHARLNFPAEGKTSAVVPVELDKVGLVQQKMKLTIAEVNPKLNLNVPLDVDPQFGYRYSEIH
jgi:hypothetical protein